eukprot:893660-Pyramimonas_sp.AAC.1
MHFLIRGAPKERPKTAEDNPKTARRHGRQAGSPELPGCPGMPQHRPRGRAPRAPRRRPPGARPLMAGREQGRRLRPRRTPPGASPRR